MTAIEKMTDTIFIYLNQEEIPVHLVSKISDYLPDTDVLITRDMGVITPVLPTINIAAGWLTPALVKSMPNVKWVHHWAAGIDSFTADADLMKRNIILTTGSGVHAIPVSEHVFALVLAFARELSTAIRAQFHHQWIVPPHPSGNTMFELTGKTMVIVGVGGIGQHIAKVARAFDMRVIGVRRDPSKSIPGLDFIVDPTSLHTVLPEADFVVLAAPLTPATRGMLGERELKHMKPSAYLINVGRGQLVQEKALITALQEGWIAGAGLDVFEVEPLPGDSPLWNMENVLITAHYAGNTPLYNARAMDLFLDNVKRYVQGLPLLNVVDPDIGY